MGCHNLVTKKGYWSQQAIWYFLASSFFPLICWWHPSSILAVCVLNAFSFVKDSAFFECLLWLHGDLYCCCNTLWVFFGCFFRNQETISVILHCTAPVSYYFACSLIVVHFSLSHSALFFLSVTNTSWFVMFIDKCGRCLDRKFTILFLTSPGHTFQLCSLAILAMVTGSILYQCLSLQSSFFLYDFIELV